MNDELRRKRENRLVHVARRYLGRPYRYGAKISHAPKAFDCSSFVKFVLRTIGIDLPRPAVKMAGAGRRVPARLDALRPGDLLFFRGTEGRYDRVFPQGIGHVAMYAGDGKIIHAKWHPQGRGKVEEASAAEWLASEDLIVIKRIF